MPRGSVIVIPPREFEIATADGFRKEVMRALATTPYLVVDLSTVAFIDSTGLSALIAAHCLAGDLGGWVALVGATNQAQKLFSITQVDRLIPSYESIDQVPANGPGLASSSS